MTPQQSLSNSHKLTPATESHRSMCQAVFMAPSWGDNVAMRVLDRLTRTFKIARGASASRFLIYVAFWPYSLILRAERDEIIPLSISRVDKEEMGGLSIDSGKDL